MIQITVNDQPHELAPETSLARLIERLADNVDTVAAVNEHFVPRSRHGEYLLQAGDRVELLAPMEGG